MTALRFTAEVAVGVMFAAGATFGIVYTLRHPEEFYGSVVDGAWFPPGRWLVRTVVLPNAAIVTLLVAGVEAALAVMILARGDFVTLGLVLGAGFATGAALVSNPAGTVANLALAVIMVVLATAR